MKAFAQSVAVAAITVLCATLSAAAPAAGAGNSTTAELGSSASWVSPIARAGVFPLVAEGKAATLLIAPGDAAVVSIAANDLAGDVERVTGVRAVVATDGTAVRGPVVLVGTLGKHAAIDALVAAGKLDVSAVRGSWETFLLATVTDPLPGVAQGLVIVGSDRRGTAFGVYELSQAIGVSPWHWWADVVPEKKAVLYVAAGTRKFGPPSVQYRGIFINDEDWGLQPWAAKTFAPEEGGIGPKVYRKVFELLLRLKANTLWPAMHACTKPFNSFPENARLADEYAIVMGSSHAEPMLRNNVGEWTAPKDDYNYVANRDGVLRYWDERLLSNGRFDNIYTLGMRGIHDSNMVGPKTDTERIATLERIFADQRALIAQHVRPEVEQVPQMFCAYKEVLDLYRQGLKVPDDVTIVWPDDNFGYVRNFASDEERKRRGGFGVYYHISYLGRPLSYLWLCTTPPALIWEEMTKAYDHGARRIWIVNVGDIKPAEIGTEFFLQLAWDVKRWGPDAQEKFLEAWATREFGGEHAKEIAAIVTDYYQLNYQRKPEHLQWWLPKEEPRWSALSRVEREERVAAFERLQERLFALAQRWPDDRGDAFMELVGYPVHGSAEANRRFFGDEFGDHFLPIAANGLLELYTRAFDERVAQGKWRGFFHLEPADDDWRSMRIAKWNARGAAPPAAPIPAGRAGECVSLEPEHFTASLPRNGAAWAAIPGLGRTGEGSVAVFPTTMPSVSLARAATDAPRLDYTVHFFTAGEFTLQANLIPAHPIRGEAQRLAVALDDAPPQFVELPFKDGSADWAQGVLNNTRTVTAPLTVATPGAHTLHVYGLEPGVVIDKLVLFRGELPPSYLGPPETRVSADAK